MKPVTITRCHPWLLHYRAKEDCPVGLTQSHQSFKSRAFSSCLQKGEVRNLKHKKDLMHPCWWSVPCGKECGWLLGAKHPLTSSEQRNENLGPQELNPAKDLSELGDDSSEMKVQPGQHLDFSFMEPQGVKPAWPLTYGTEIANGCCLTSPGASNSKGIPLPTRSFFWCYHLLKGISFPTAVVTYHRRLCGLNNANMLLYNSGAQKIKMRLTGLKSKDWYSCNPSGGPENYFLLFPVDSGRPRFLARSSLLAIGLSDLCFHPHISFSDSDPPTTVSYL